MRKKFFLAWIIIAFIPLSLISTSKAFQTGPGATPSDTRFNEFGPAPNRLIVNVYTGGYSPEFTAFNNKQIDFMDSNLQPADYTTIKTEDPTNATYQTGTVTPFGLREFDMNQWVAPFNNTNYRRGLSSCISRTEWMTEYFPSGGLPAYTVLQSQGSWADPALASSPYYPQDFLAAYGYFCAAYGAPVQEGVGTGAGNTSASTWVFPNSYPTAAANPNPAAYNGSGPAVPNDEILFYIRTEQAERQASGDYLVYEAHTAFADWCATHVALINSTYPSYPVPKPGGTVLPPEIDFYVVHASHTVTNYYVMTSYRFQLYTGGWATGSTPDFMEVWLYADAPVNVGWAKNAYNFASANDSQFDTAERAMEKAPQGNALTRLPETAYYYSDQCQVRLGGQALVIPWYIYSGESSCLTSTQNAINALGVGFSNWYSLFNAVPTSGSPGYGTNTIYCGWESDLRTNANPVSSAIPISSTSTCDWYLISEIYDSITSQNPYNMTDFRPSLANNFTVTVNPSINDGNTVIYLHMRNDVYWQDVPYKDRSAYAIPYLNNGTSANGHELDGAFTNFKLTVLDLAYTELMAKYLNNYEYVPIHDSYAYDVDHVSISSYWNNTGGWPWSAPGAGDPPFWNSTFSSAWASPVTSTMIKSFVGFDLSLSPDEINLYLTEPLTWQAYYTDLALPVFPLHIFKYLACGPWMHNGVAVPDVYAMNLGPQGANLEYGTGPFIWTGSSPGFSYMLTAYKPGASYGDIVEQNGYFAFVHDLAVVGVTPSQRLVLSGAMINITVQVANKGEYSEASNLTLHVGSTLLASRETGLLNPGHLTTYGFSWDTTAFAPGCYFIKASVAPVLYETDLSNNNCVNGTVIIGAETRRGTNVTVSPASSAQVTFTQTTTTGVTTLNVTQPPSPTLTAAANSVFVDIKTNATYSGNVKLQFAYNTTGLTLEDEKAMRMWLWNTTSSAWRDVTTYVNTTEHVVYGVSPHLSCFGITCTLSLTGGDGQSVQTVTQPTSSPPAQLPDSLAAAYFDIQATTPYKSPVTVRLAYDPSTISPQQALFLQMWHWNTTSMKWDDITTRVDTANNVVYGTSPHLSCFGITSLQPFPKGIVATGAACSKTVVSRGYNLTINVPIQNQQNQGSLPQSFTVFVYANTTVIYSKQISNLLPSALTGVAFNFTASLTYGNYSISACDQPISWVKVAIPGDANGDGIVNIMDVGVIAAHWLQPVPPSAPPKLANADINSDGIVNIMDVGVIAAHWLQTTP